MQTMFNIRRRHRVLNAIYWQQRTAVAYAILLITPRVPEARRSCRVSAVAQRRFPRRLKES